MSWRNGSSPWAVNGIADDSRIASRSFTIHTSFAKKLIPMTDSTPRFGFVAFAETWNGRLAMLGFVIGLGTEILTGQGILAQVGLG